MLLPGREPLARVGCPLHLHPSGGGEAGNGVSAGTVLRSTNGSEGSPIVLWSDSLIDYMI